MLGVTSDPPQLDCPHWKRRGRPKGKKMYTGKKLDLDKFLECLADFLNGKISIQEYARRMGVSGGTIKTRVDYYIQHGDLKDEWFNGLKERRETSQRLP